MKVFAHCFLKGINPDDPRLLFVRVLALFLPTLSGRMIRLKRLLPGHSNGRVAATNLHHFFCLPRNFSGSLENLSLHPTAQK